jgi:hypothetical protein
MSEPHLIDLSSLPSKAVMAVLVTAIYVLDTALSVARIGVDARRKAGHYD